MLADIGNVKHVDTVVIDGDESRADLNDRVTRWNG
jgi:hypothetical protein